jgi:tRNA pseudouridine32 synthase / 23S rRNA pseudouridine746 synthase
MELLHALSDFIDHNYPINHHHVNTQPNYYYQGYCPLTGELLKLPRTNLAENIARGLMEYLASDKQYAREGKMYGILIVELPSGEQRILKAFSGLLNGSSQVDGWVPPIYGRDEVKLDEHQTLLKLEAIKQEIIALQQIPEREQYKTIVLELEVRSQNLKQLHQQRKQQRHQKRIIRETLVLELEQLDAESRQDGIEYKLLKQEINQELHPIKQVIGVADQQILELKQSRKELSRQLQAQMHATYSLTNFLGMSRTLRQLIPLALPTGTGDCCAPKLLNYAAINNFKPLAMAEFWWGDSSRTGDKIAGNFYGACAERCQPIMGFLLSGIEENKQGDKERNKRKGNKEENTQSVIHNFHYQLPIIYQDEYLIAINKPAGLLSVPGRYHDTQDSVLSRLQNLMSDGMNLMAIHRLDQETSGILLLARNLDIYRHISQQFQQRQVHKIYEAVLSGLLETQSGVIQLPLWGNPENRPSQEVNFIHGKSSITHFQVLERQELERQKNHTRVEFKPITGRTHQLRVHSADKMGLNIPILGDKLYGCDADASRLHLHGRELVFEHPISGKILKLIAKAPF